MKKYEYLTYKVTSVCEHGVVHCSLNSDALTELGLKGWELTCSVGDKLIFKREVEEETSR